MDKQLNMTSCYTSDDETNKTSVVTSDKENKVIAESPLSNNAETKKIIKRKNNLTSSDEENNRNKKKTFNKRQKKTSDKKIKRAIKKNYEKPEKQYIFGGGSIFKESVLLNHFKNVLNHPPIIFFPCPGHNLMETEKKD